MSIWPARAGIRSALSPVTPGPAIQARLVELDPRNAALASDGASAAGLDQVEVVVGDASVTTAYEGELPADLILVCDVFGQATDEDIHPHR